MTRLALLAVLLLAAPAAACPGDCNGDGAVTVNELVLAVGIALGQTAPAACAAVDVDGDGQASIAELVGAANGLLLGCAEVTPSATPPAASATPSAIPTQTPTPTATVNQPPVAATPFLYRGFAGLPIELPLGVVDPEGEALQCVAEPLLPGMTLAADQVLRWTPAADQLGVVSLPYTCADGGEPPGEANGALQVRVAGLDACTQPTCGAAGCTATVLPLGSPCCGAPAARVPEPEPLCPQGRLLMLGRNTSGFGRLQNCNVLRFYRQAQSTAQLRVHLRFSCLNTSTYIDYAIRLDTRRGKAVDAVGHFLIARPGAGFQERRNLRPDFLIDGPFTSIENTDAILTVTLTDVDGASVTESVRVIITSDSLVPDLPDP